MLDPWFQGLKEIGMNNGEFDESVPQADQRPLGSGLGAGQTSTFLGNDDRGHPCFDNQRTEVGEATYQLKYQKDWNQVGPLAKAVATNVFPKLDQVGFVVPMPASNIRQRQPVTEVALALGRIVGRPVFSDLLRKA